MSYRREKWVRGVYSAQKDVNPDCVEDTSLVKALNEVLMPLDCVGCHL